MKSERPRQDAFLRISRGPDVDVLVADVIDLKKFFGNHIESLC